MRKTLLALVAVSAFTGGLSSIAEAKTTFNLYLGTPYYDRQIGPDYEYYPDRGWYRPNLRPGYYQRISCNEARDIVRDRGYRNVIAQDCVGKTFTFTGRRNGQRFTLYVNARTGSVSRS
jgi:hypothetical protein